MGTFVSPIDGQTYSTEWTGGATSTTLKNPYADPYVWNQRNSESAVDNPFTRWTGTLTNTPGERLQYSNPIGGPAGATDEWRWMDELGWMGGPTVNEYQQATPEYEKWLSHYWAYEHPEEYLAEKAASDSGTGFFDGLKSFLTSPVMRPFYAAMGAGMLGVGGAAAAEGAGAAGAGMLGSGMSAGQLGSLGMNVGYGTALSGTAGALGGAAALAGANVGSVAPAGWTQSAWDGLMSGNYSAVTGANAGSGAMEWTDFLGDASIGDIAGSGGGSSLADLQSAANQYGWSDLASPGTTAGANADIAGSSWLNNLAQSAMNNPLGTAAKAIKSLGMTPAQVLGGGLNAVGGLLAGNAAQGAANTTANAQLEAARIAAEAAKFKPIGITTRFGRSNFQKDAQGNVIGAGYALTPDMKAQQDALMAQSGQMLTQYQSAPGMFAPMGQAGQRAMGLGNQYLATDPAAQAQKYMAEQQALLATGRERDMNQMLTSEFNQGTYGLATGGTSTGMGAANPRLEALMNAQRQQDLGLAAQSTQGGMDYAKFGAAMSGTGGDLTRGMFSGQTAAYQPYQTALQGAQYIEGLGQQPLTMGIDIGKQTSNAASGGLLAQGMVNAAQTQQNAAYSPWGTLLMGAGNQVQNYQNQQQQQQQQQALMASLWGK